MDLTTVFAFYLLSIRQLQRVMRHDLVSFENSARFFKCHSEEKTRGYYCFLLEEKIKMQNDISICILWTCSFAINMTIIGRSSYQ